MDAGQLTSGLMWRVTLITALIDTPLVILAARWVSLDQFRNLKWYLVCVAVFVYAAIWAIFGSIFFWSTVYQSVFPAWSRWLLPLGFGLLYGALAFVFFRISLLLARLQVVWFILLGGIVSLAGHGIGVSRGLFQVPMLAETSIASALTFGVFEFIFYWCMIVGISVAIRWFSLWLKHVGG